MTGVQTCALPILEMEKGNAYAHFYLAGFLAKNIESSVINEIATDNQVRGQLGTILGLITTGTTCANYNVPTDGIKLVPLLRSPYALFGSEGNPLAVNPTEFVELASLLTRCAKGLGKSDIGLAKRCSHAMIAMGKRILLTLPSSGDLIPDNRPSERMVEIIANSTVRLAYNDLLKIYQEGGNKQELSVIKRERDAFVFPLKIKEKKYLARTLGSGANN